MSDQEDREPDGPLVDNRPNRNQFECRQWMFSPNTGDYLRFDDEKNAAVCDPTGFQLPYEQFHGFNVKRSTRMDIYRRKYDIDPLIKDYEVFDTTKRAARATTQETCENCGHELLEYFTMQLRSADEGQTIFFECTKCRHKWRQNN